jgi:uncharacterized protein YecE (DUF72 family)
MKMLDNIFLGTSGWLYKDWIGPFYNLKEKSFLRYYSKFFKTVEIDSTFYSFPSEKVVVSWIKNTPIEFIFTAKMPKEITHAKNLDVKKISEKINRFVDILSPLISSNKLNCILIQFPPTFKLNIKGLEEFLSILPYNIKYAVEFRDLSWIKNETFNLLEKYNVAYTIVDEPLLPSDVIVTSDIAYIRWHGRGEKPWYNYRYNTEELNVWIPKIQEVSKSVKVVYGYFNNHFHGYAVENCLQMLEMLGIINDEQKKLKKKIEDYKIRIEKEKTTLKTFFDYESFNDLELLLTNFINENRMIRAKEIKNDEIKNVRITNDLLEAEIRKYKIVIDMKNKIITHNCADWQKLINEKKFCKHIGKLFLYLKTKHSLSILKDLYNNVDSWKFIYNN